MDRIRVVLADDHPLLTMGLELAIEGWDEFEVVGVASNGADVVELCLRLSPDLVVVDMQMPELSGGEAIARIKAALPDTHILVLTTFDDEGTVAEAMDAGCDGFLLKAIEQERLRASMLSIANGMSVFDKAAISTMRRRAEADSKSDFTAREREIMRHICNGMTNIEIANELVLRPGTVKNLVSLLLSKTNCVSRAQLARYAIDHHLVD